MIKTIQRRFALSYQGAKDFLRGVLFTTLLDLALMLPAVYVFLFLDDWLKPLLVSEASPVHGLFYYGLLGIGFMGVMYVIGFFQYNSTFTSVYDESAIRRVSLAEKLRILPLAFFGEKNLSDLTATIMDDCTDMEHTFSHAVPQLFASLIAILLISIGMFFYNWQLALALFWVVPVAMALLIFSQRKMRMGNRENYQNKRAVSEAIQEGLDNIQEIKAYIDNMQRLFFFSENKYYSIMLPFTMKIDNDVVTFYYCGINIDAELVSNFISILNSDLYNSQSCWDFMTPIYELETKNVNFWKIFSYLLSCDLGYLRFDYDEKGFLDAQKRGTPHIHPKHHLDINFSNSSTFKSGLIKKISQQEFIDIVDNKKKRWFLKDER